MIALVNFFHIYTVSIISLHFTIENITKDIDTDFSRYK